MSTLMAPSMGADMNIDLNIDMDMDIDLGLDIVPDQTDLLQVAVSEPSNTSEPQLLQGALSDEAVPHKIYIRGVDDFDTSHIRNFSTTHFPSHLPLRVEWIDDSSANIVFDSSDTALEALNNFTHLSNGNVDGLHRLQSRSAKPLPSHPGSTLQVRIAVSTDCKHPRAHEFSRFYLLHPELDPRERRRKDRNQDHNSGYRRPRYGDDEQRRRKKGADDEGFTASMYDDNVGALASRDDRRNSGSSFSSGIVGSSRGDSYRPKRSSARPSRDRSASPGKELDEEGRRRIRRRTPPPRYRREDPHPYPRENSGKELFPARHMSRDVGEDLRGFSDNTNAKELFPNKKAASNLKKELFPLKVGTPVHRRSDAFDAADETADLFASGMTVPFTDGTMDNVRLRSDPDTSGFNIRGASKLVHQEFSIRGVASGVSSGVSVKELFPGKAGNAGKELFAEKLDGRGGRRNKAVDMFY